ncbi:MAG: DNA cytosine methyltransferase [Acidobacteria bacterium]|nr:DNA cytosine methyltransferase [Acidobacteriota bacterium]
MKCLHSVALFAGSGQLDLAADRACRRVLGVELRPVCYVENSEHAARVLRARIRDDLLPDAPIWPDVRTFPGARYRGHVDALTAGFPCQPFSVAGKRAGERDARYLFGHVMRTAVETGAGILWLENVPGIRYPDEEDLDDGSSIPVPAPLAGVARLLAESGFAALWGSLAADDLDAPHARERWWCLAVADAENAHWRTGAAQLESSARVGRG